MRCITQLPEVIAVKNIWHEWDFPKTQKRPVAKTFLQIEKQYQDRNVALFEAYRTGAYSQREIAEHYNLHPSTVGVIVRKFKDS